MDFLVKPPRRAREVAEISPQPGRDPTRAHRGGFLLAQSVIALANTPALVWGQPAEAVTEAQRIKPPDGAKLTGSTMISTDGDPWKPQ